MKAKLRAYVGKYLKILTILPLQSAKKPSSLLTLVKQSIIPVYFTRVFDNIFLCTSYVCSNSLTLSIGAVKVLASVAENPPAIKSVRKSDFF